MAHALTGWEAGLTLGSVILNASRIAAGLLLIAGLWTPASGALLTGVGLWPLVSRGSSDPWADILLATIGVALGLLGPGAWSVDARLFGWKRIDLSDLRSPK
jgi:putative oxidoreductase